ncbi:MAG: hypothetical protein A2798_04070 [Candidatus Levybacteria bacterium RIFCSPHIGHO2_01_FULL_37_17]|nr:MAG: hypothetical protein A2798_04070 [Candidatus Levybacteria bacterium RIFCSPHIGHO2_01_FULL_37_17]OGH36523.1 MAG: hypothetical protein A2959_03465 [Candidatus Levybacteria bacterium RIFCSPLOWO2_01_FULL_38_23]
MLEKDFVLPRKLVLPSDLPQGAIEERRAIIEETSSRARLSPDQRQARRDELEFAEIIFSAKPASSRA